MKEAGYVVDEVSSALQDTFNLGQQGLTDALNAAGYAADQVNNALKDAGYAIEDAGKTISHYMNPSHW